MYEVVIQDSEFINNTQLMPFKCTILTEDALILRMAHTAVTSTVEPLVCVRKIAGMPSGMDFFTLKSNFTAGNRSVSSADHKFDTKSFDMIQNIPVDMYVHQMESKYSSSKLLISSRSASLFIFIICTYNIIFMPCINIDINDIINVGQLLEI